jgi:hypothetical protein
VERDDTDDIDHDRLFKELVTEFFTDFIDLFFPEVSKYLDRDSVHFLDKEVFTDVTSGDRHEVDVLAKARFKGRDAFFLVHIETQASAQSDFPKRMFRYFARLHEKHDLPVYPIALFSYDAPQRAEPDRYEVSFPDAKVLDFHFRVIQLNRLNWRDFVRRQNPVASALMAKMRIAPEDRPRVKLECLRLLATLKLNPAKMQLIAGFVERYLRLAREEQQVFRVEVAQLLQPEQERVMELTISWKEEGKHEMAVSVVRRQLAHRFGPLPEPLSQQIEELPLKTISDLAEALLDFTSLADAQAWIKSHS